MKKLLLEVLVTFIFCSLTNAQNLVPNPSFEDYTECPSALTFIEYAFPWNGLTLSTDYYNVCFPNLPTSVPHNAAGYQLARTGNGYGGFSIFSKDENINLDHREYMGTPLSMTLQQDSFYIIEFFVSNASSIYPTCDCLDVWMLDSLDLNLPDPLFIGDFIENVTPQMESPQGYFIQDTLNWIRMNWVYQAKGNENMLIIGNFSTDEETNYIVPDIPIFLSTYFFIDDVTVKKIPEYYAQIDIGNDTTVCDSFISQTLTAQPIYDTYLWNTGETTQSITITSAGTYWVDVGFGGDCIARDIITIHSKATEMDEFPNYLEICYDELPYRIAAPDSMMTYLWSNGSDSSYLEISQSGIYWVETEYACGIWRDTIEINVVEPEVINLGLDTVLCNQPTFSEILFAPNGYDNYLWSTGASTPEILIESPGIYWVIAENICGQFYDTIQILNQPLLELELGNDTTFCEGENFLLESNSGFEEYFWNLEEGGNSLLVDQYGIYTLEASYACGIVYDTIEIFPAPEIWITLPMDTIICANEIINLKPVVSFGNYSYLWSPINLVSCTNCPTTNISTNTDHSFQVTIIDEFDCKATAEIFVNVEELSRVFIPNAFSPNGDNKNDFFTIYGGREVVEIQELRIFDNWGEIVFEQKNFFPNDESLGWDGFFKGKKMNPGVFVVAAVILFKDGKVEKYFKDVTLLK